MVISDGVRTVRRPHPHGRPSMTSAHEPGDVGGEGLADAEVDARFAELVAGLQDLDALDLETPPDDGVVGAEPAGDRGRGIPSPQSEVSGPTAVPTAEPDASPSGAPPTPTPTPAPGEIIVSIPVWRGATGPSLLEPEADEDEGYTPPPVHLPPGEDLHYWGAVTGLVLGPLLVLYVVIVRPLSSTWWLLGGIGCIIGGFALLIWRAPAHRDPDDADDGARV